MSRNPLLLALGGLALAGLMLRSWDAWDQVTREPLLHGDPSITHCPLHGNRLFEGRVPWVEGGMPVREWPLERGGETTGSVRIPRNEREAESMLFPFAHTTVASGCIWSPSMAKVRIRVRYCTACREAQIRWKRENSGGR
jgi:hypothetical protein